MQYRYAAQCSYEDFASGSVLRSAPGHPGFPVRLASELFSRAAHDVGRVASLCLWDPCCGSGQLVTSVGFLHRSRLSTVIASDIDTQVVQLARSNLALLTKAGLHRRMTELEALASRYDKESHRRAVESARRLARYQGDAPTVRVGVADAVDPVALADVVGDARPDVVLGDLPYGEQTQWSGLAGDSPAAMFLGGVVSVVPSHAVVVLVSRGRKTAPLPIKPSRVLRVGTRVASFYRAGEAAAALNAG